MFVWGVAELFDYLPILTNRMEGNGTICSFGKSVDFRIEGSEIFRKNFTDFANISLLMYNFDTTE